LKADGQAILLSITDDGVGLRRQPSRHSGMGMRIMRYRASVIGGSLAVSRNAEGGTTVRCSVPNRLIPRRRMISP
jgi:signal transduction histidine kinase